MKTETTQAAYDYDTQQWRTGTEAAQLRRKQIEESLALATGPRGDSYCQFIGASKAELIANLRAELANL